jgi:hypothetical protein
MGTHLHESQDFSSNLLQLAIRIVTAKNSEASETTPTTATESTETTPTTTTESTETTPTTSEEEAAKEREIRARAKADEAKAARSREAARSQQEAQEARMAKERTKESTAPGSMNKYPGETCVGPGEQEVKCSAAQKSESSPASRALGH